jgi:Cu/Ag efflux pump CusA
MSLSKFFIDRPIFAGVISVIIFLAGLIAMTQLPISEYPEVVPPSVVVTAQFPGANPDTIASTVATPLENRSTVPRTCFTCPRRQPATARSRSPSPSSWAQTPIW